MGLTMDRSAAVPTEDTIETLVDHLVFPLLPIRDSLGEAPGDRQQMMVAKQMHAVAVLYNYYHRKQFPELEVLDFISLCKLCCIARPGILMYMSYIHGCEEDFENPNSHLSITENMVRDACDICVGLDSSTDNPIMDGWPISKVAVFLVDSTKEKCLLQFCSITQGVWSLVEKVLGTWHDNSSSQNEYYKSEKMLEELAFSAVEEETGISRTDLSILERHLTYSLSHEKTSARLYIVKYGNILNEELTEVAIKDVVRSSEGPLVKKDPTCEVTQVVEYYNILPYIDVISSWLSRSKSFRDSLDMPAPTVKKETCSLEPDKISSMEDHDVSMKSASNEFKFQFQNRKPGKSGTIEMCRNDLPSRNGSSGVTRRPETRDGSPCVEPTSFNVMQHQAMNDQTMQKGQDEYVLNIKKDKLKDIITYTRKNGRSSQVTNSCSIVDHKHPTVPDQSHRTVSTKGYIMCKTSDSSEQKLQVKSNDMVKTESETINDIATNNGSFSAFTKSQKTADISQGEPDNLIMLREEQIKDKSFHNGQTENITVSKKTVEDAITNNKESCDSCTKDVLTRKCDAVPLSHFEQPSYSGDFSTNIISDASAVKGKNSIHNTIPISGDKACIVDSVKYIQKCTVDDKSSSSGATQDGCAGVILPPMLSSSDHNTFYHVTASEKQDLLQASMQVFQIRRNELCLQKRLLDDEIARCEMSIQRILREGEECPATKVESIIEALNGFCSSPVRTFMDLCEEQSPSVTIKRRKLSEAILSLSNPCQELDDICHKNSWVLPRYSVLPSLSDRTFKATVTIHGPDFECKNNGEPKSSPREARESAAGCMMKTLRKWQAEK